MVVKIAGVRMCMWRAVDDEDEVLDVLVQKRRMRRPPQAGAIAREQPGREFSPAGATV